MNRQLSSRSRKQRLPCNQISSNFLQSSTSVDADYEAKDNFEDATPPTKIGCLRNGLRKTSDVRDRQAQIDHNDQERGRRRELAIIYEMIRTCITEEDIRRHLDGTAKSPEKLSYPQLLQISCGMIDDEIHDMAVYERLVKEIDILEQECVKYNIPIHDKPRIIPPMKRHEIVASVVEDILKNDRKTRNASGTYLVSHQYRALKAHQRLIHLLGDEPGISGCLSSAGSRRLAPHAVLRLTRSRSFPNPPVPSFKPCQLSPPHPEQNDYESPNHHQHGFAIASSNSPQECLPFPNEAYYPAMSPDHKVDAEIVEEYFAIAENVESNLNDPGIDCIDNEELVDYAFDTLFSVVSNVSSGDSAMPPFM